MSKAYVSRALRRQVIERARGRCEYCLIPQMYSSEVFHIDHIVSEKQLGPTEAENLAWACAICNLNKGSCVSVRFYEEKILVPLYNPREDDWSEHFMLGSSGQITALTMVGKGTIRLLQLDHPDRIEERRLIMSMGVGLIK